MRFALVLLLSSWPAAAATHFLIVSGLGGQPGYEKRFREEAAQLAEVAAQTSADPARVHLLEGDRARLDAIVDQFLEFKKDLGADDRLAVFLIGHGSWDLDDYKFNIPGPDLTARRLAALLDSVPAKRQLAALATSSSGAALEALKAAGRIVVTATKSGRERNATAFSRYWAAALEDPEADTDKDESISAQEAFNYAQEKVKTFFESTNHLATEHPQIEGDFAASFTLARLGSSAKALQNPALRPLIERREKIQMQIDALKLEKDALSEDDYFNQLEALLIDLAKVEARISAGATEKDDSGENQADEDQPGAETTRDDGSPR